ncbi:hypothetical protein [Modestobacter sp. SYSU DS0290]
MESTDLHDRLHRLAERTAPPPRHDLAEVVATRHRTQRRQALALTAVAAAVAAVVVAAPTLLTGSPPTAVSSASPAMQRFGADVLAGPTRGSLAGDRAFVEGVRQLAWTTGDEPAAGNGYPGVPDPPEETRWVVFAGDVAGGRWALVAGENTARPQPPYDAPERQTDLGALGDTAIAWFVGPPGATVEQMELVGPQPVDPSQPQALADGVTGALVVITAPGDEVAVSARPEVAADATVSRTWQPVDAPDGVAVVELPPNPTLSGYSQALSFRVQRDGQEVLTSGPWSRWNPDAVAAEVPVTWLRDRPTASEVDRVLEGRPQELLARTGASPEEAEVSVVWAGDVPSPMPEPAGVHLVTATLPSGASYTEALLHQAMADGSVAGTMCGTELRPAGPPLPEQTFVLRCDATDFSLDPEAVSSLVVVGPATAVTARALDADGAVVDEFPLTDGVAVVPAPDQVARVETVDATGRTVARTPVMGHADWGD